MRRFCYLLILTIGCQSLADLGSLEQLQKKTASMLSGASGAGRDLEAAEYLMGKFKFDQDGKPTWYPEFYPRSTDFDPSNGVKPRIRLYRPVGPEKLLLAPILEVFRRKNGSGGNCESNFINLSPTYKSFGAVSGTDFCMEGAKEYAVDHSALASLEKISTIMNPDEIQGGFISVLNMEALNDSQKNQFMKDPNTSVDTLLNALPTESDKQALFDPRKIRFLQYIPAPDQSFLLHSIRVQAGGLVFDAKVGPPPFQDPGSLACEIEPVSERPIPLNPDTNEVEVRFRIKANSVISAADVSLDNGNEGRLNEEDFLPYETSNFGKLVRVSKNDVVLKLTKADLQDARIHRTQDKYQSNVNHQVWTVTGKVQGVDQSNAPALCKKDILINFPLAPSCRLANVSPTKVHQNGNISFDLDCRQGGPVQSVEVRAKVNGAVLRTESRATLTTIPDADRWFRGFNYIRMSEREGEVIEVVTHGLMNQSTTVVQYVDGICPWTNPQYTGIKNFWNRNFSLRDRAYYHFPHNCPSNEICLDQHVEGRHHFCVHIRNLSSPACGEGDASNMSDHSEILWRTTSGRAIWFNRKEGPNLVAYARAIGCFTPNTQIKMANGSLKLASDIHENDYVFNPHYRTGIRVRKVVKGPEKKSLYEVKTSAGKVEVTEDHPFLTGRGWVQAMSLKKGDKLLGDGKPKLVGQVKKLKYQGPQDVWNFELDTEDPMAHVVVANGIPTGDLVTQLELKKPKAKLP